MENLKVIHNSNVFASTKDGQKIQFELISSIYTDESHWVATGPNGLQDSEIPIFKMDDKWYINMSGSSLKRIGIKADIHDGEIASVELFNYSPSFKADADKKIENAETTLLEDFGKVTFIKWGKGRIARGIKNEKHSEISIIKSDSGKFSVRAENHFGLQYDQLSHIARLDFNTLEELTPHLKKLGFKGHL